MLPFSYSLVIHITINKNLNTKISKIFVLGDYEDD